MMNEKKLITPPGMKRFYFTYGSDPHYPFLHGWTEVIAPDEATACAVFRCYHPCRKGRNLLDLNCAWVYTESGFKKTGMFTSPSPKDYCHEVIGPQYFDHTASEAER